MSNTYKRLIIDGNNFLFRAYYADMHNKQTGEEKDKSVMTQFFKMLKNLSERYRPETTFFAWDNKQNPDGHNFRNDLVEYKSQRVMTDEALSILALHDPIQDILNNLGIHTIYPWNLEADDVICFLSKLEDGRNLIVSSDKDLLQLVSDNTDLLLATKNLLVNNQNFEMHANIGQQDFVLYKSILGDPSDNIPGLKGFGPVKSKKLVEELRDRDIKLASDDREKLLTDDQWKIIMRNIEIIDLSKVKTVYPDEIAQYDAQLAVSPVFDGEKAKELFEQHGIMLFVRTFNDFKRLFHKTVLTDNEFTLESIMERI